MFLVSFFYMSSDWRDDYCEQLDDKTFGNDDFQGIPGRCWRMATSATFRLWLGQTKMKVSWCYDETLVWDIPRYKIEKAWE